MYGKTKVSTLFKGKKHTWILYCAAFKINLWEIKATGIIHWYLMDHLDRPGYLTLMPYITFPSKKLSFPSCPKAKAQCNRTGTTWQCKSAAPLFFSDHLIVWINFLSTRLQGNRPPLSKCPINSKHKWPKHKIECISILKFVTWIILIWISVWDFSLGKEMEISKTNHFLFISTEIVQSTCINITPQKKDKY